MTYLQRINYTEDVFTNYKDLSIWDKGEAIYYAEEDSYIEKPVDIVTFIKDPYYLGNSLGDEIYDYWLELLQEIHPHPCINMYNEFILSTAIGVGKCHGLGTKILMYDGSIKNVEDVVVGDKLMGDDSTPRNVLSLARGRENMYRIIPNRGGESFTCNESHILSLKRTNDGRTDRVNEIENISMRDYINKSSNFKNLYKLYRKEVSFNKKELKIDPYIYGLWIGDGATEGSYLTTADKEIEDIWCNYGKAIGLEVHKYSQEGNKSSTYRLTTGKTSGKAGRNIFLNVIKNSTKSGHKRILPEYLQNSEESRLKLLAGIVDSDGYVNHNGGQITITTKYKDLAEDYVYLARSLGMQSSLKESVKTIKKINFKDTYYNVYISGTLCNIPTVLLRKKMSNRKLNKDPLKTGFKVESLGEGDYYGFELDGNHLYMLGDFTVTHNTTIAIASMVYEMYKLMCLKDPYTYYLQTKKLDPFAFTIMTPDKAQGSSVAFSKFLGMVNTSPYFIEKKATPKARTTASDEGVIINDIILVNIGSNINHLLGKMNFSCLMDEVSYYLGKEAIKKAEDIHQLFKTRRKSRFDKFSDFMPGILWLVSSPVDEQDYLNSAIETVKSNPFGNYRDNLSSWQVKGAFTKDTFKVFLGDAKRDPKVIEEDEKTTPDMEESIIDVPYNYYTEFKEALIRNIRDIAGRRVHADVSLFKSRQLIRSLFVNPNRFVSDTISMSFSDPSDKLENYVTNLEYFKRPLHQDSFRFVHLDIATKKDRFGLSSVYSTLEEFELVPTIENPEIPRAKRRERMFYVDFAIGIEAKKGEEINIIKVIDFLFLLIKMGYPIKVITTDMFQGDVTRQFLRTSNVETDYLSVDRTKDPYYTLRELVYTNKIIGVKNELLITELLGLRDLDKKIDHISNNSKDIADSVCGGIWKCINSKDYMNRNQVYMDLSNKDGGSPDLGLGLSQLMRQARTQQQKEQINKTWNFK